MTSIECAFSTFQGRAQVGIIPALRCAELINRKTPSLGGYLMGVSFEGEMSERSQGAGRSYLHHAAYCFGSLGQWAKPHHSYGPMPLP